MIKPAPAQKIEDIEKKNIGYWVLVAITKRDRYSFGTHGRLLARSKHRDPIYKKAEDYVSEPLYIGYSGKPMNRDYCLWHRVVD